MRLNRKSQPYNPEMYKKHRHKRYRKHNKCSLIGCKNKIARFVPGEKKSKYCCEEHAEIARKYREKIWMVDNVEHIKQYFKQWRKDNPELVKAQQERRRLSRIKERNVIKKINPDEFQGVQPQRNFAQ